MGNITRNRVTSDASFFLASFIIVLEGPAFGPPSLPSYVSSLRGFHVKLFDASL